MRFEKFGIGQKFKTNGMDEIEIVDKVEDNINRRVVRFNNGYLLEVDISAIRKGNVKNPFIKTTCGVGYFGIHKNAIKSKEFHTALNEINQKVMSKWFYETNEDESDVTIVIEADYYDYERTTFGKFIDQLNSEDSFGMQLLKKFIEKDNR